jgi:hypothetical protein
MNTTNYQRMCREIADYLARLEEAALNLSSCRGIGYDTATALIRSLVVDGAYTLPELADWTDERVAEMCGEE